MCVVGTIRCDDYTQVVVGNLQNIFQIAFFPKAQFYHL